MDAFLLQPWTTVAGNGPTLTQDAGEWLDLAGFADVTFWIDVSQVVTSSGATLTLTFQTSPTPDETYFQPLTPPITLQSTPGAPVTQIVVSSVTTGSTVPVARWVRWQLSLSGAPPWLATFRVRAVPYRQSFFAPTQVAGCVLWLRADLGVSLGASSTVATWQDQSLVGDTNKDLLAGTVAPTFSSGQPEFNGLPGIIFTSGSPGTSLTSRGSWATPLAAPATWFIFAGNNNPPGTLAFLFDGNDAGLGQSLSYTPQTGTGANSTVAIGHGTVLTLNTGSDTTSIWPLGAFISGQWNGANSAIDFNSEFAVGGNGPSASQTSMIVGCEKGGSAFWTGSIAEIIAYSGIPSATDQNRILEYFSFRYGIG